MIERMVLVEDGPANFAIDNAAALKALNNFTMQLMALQPNQETYNQAEIQRLAPQQVASKPGVVPPFTQPGFGPEVAAPKTKTVTKMVDGVEVVEDKPRRKINEEIIRSSYVFGFGFSQPGRFHSVLAIAV